MTKQIIAEFIPQIWVNDYAIKADPLGETKFDVTAAILEMDKYTALDLVDDTYETDELRYSTNAPEWVQEWSGPFYIRVETEIARYFDEN